VQDLTEKPLAIEFVSNCQVRLFQYLYITSFKFFWSLKTLPISNVFFKWQGKKAADTKQVAATKLWCRKVVDAPVKKKG